MTDNTARQDAEIEELLAELSDDDRNIVAPPSDVWDAIAAEVATDRPGSTPASDTIANVVPLAPRRLRAMRLLSAAAVLLIAMGVGVALLSSGANRTRIAGAELAFDADAFDPAGASTAATVSLVEIGDGYEIEFDSSDLLDALEEDADLELWLISLDADGAPADVVSLGVVDADEPGRHSLPAGLDPEVHFVVDISIEPRDGDELHSGRSILRGALA